MIHNRGTFEYIPEHDLFNHGELPKPVGCITNETFEVLIGFVVGVVINDPQKFRNGAPLIHTNLGNQPAELIAHVDCRVDYDPKFFDDYLGLSDVAATYRHHWD